MKRILVTGATGGVGQALARMLAARGDVLLAHGRDRASVEGLVAELRGAGGDAQPYVADLSSLAEVRRLASEVEQLDVLVNNAGVGFGRDRTRRETSRDGFELRLAVNYLAPFLPTELLAGARAVVNVASAGQSPLDEEDLMMEHGYDGVLAYMRSKLALVMDTFERSRREPRRPCLTLHPGTFLATKMVRDAGITPLGRAEDGAAAVLAAIDRAIDGETGLYFDVTHPARANAAGYDQEGQARLRAKALEFTAPFR